MDEREGARVLVVDDQRSTVMLVCAMLSQAGYRVDECVTGFSAIEAMSRLRYDLIVLDMNLPDISGLDLLRRVRSPKLPAVLGMTSGITLDLIVRAEAAGVSRVLEKPIGGPELIAVASAVIHDTRSTPIVACGGPAIDQIVLDEIRTGCGEALFRRFLEQALADAWQCMNVLGYVPAADIAGWRQQVRALNGVARSIGARRLASAIDEALPLSALRLVEIAGAVTRQLTDLLDEAQEALGEWLRPRLHAVQEGSDDCASLPVSTQLSERERAILHWAAVGKTSLETAAILGISGRTVAFHVANILFKLDAVNKTQAVAKAVHLNLLD